MDMQMLISLILLVTVLEIFIVFLFIKYKQGKIERNPFIIIFEKEWKILYYAFFRWRIKDNNKDYFLYKNSHYFWLFIALLHEQVIEMVVFHIYLKKVDPVYANIMSALHIYSIIYMIGDYNWVRNTPIRIVNNKIEMKIGARRELSFHISDIESVQKTQLTYTNKGGIIHEKGVFHATSFPRVLTRIFGITDELRHEIIFNKPIFYTGYFGLKKQVNKTLIYIKDSDRLAAILEEKMKEYELSKYGNKQEVQKEGTNKKQSIINWKIYFTLLFMNVIGAIAISPYAMAREGFHHEVGVSEWHFTLIFVGQMLVEGAALIFLALLMGKSVGVKLPIITSFIRKEKIQYKNLKYLGFAIIYGVITSIVIMIVSYFISNSLGIDNSSINEPVWWLGILGSLGAGITEETIFRLFLVTFVLWLFFRLRKKKDPTNSAKWIAIIIASLIFGLLHYGVAASTYEMTLGLFLGMILINGIGGITFGALFIYRGLEFAIIAHFIADIMIHVVTPMFI
jgi:membrane protease YdiL (CAAX protease family)